MNGLIVDLFAGGGGASVGIEAALGRPVDIAINHDHTALAVHKANHSRTRHLEADIWEVKPRAATKGQPVALLWASPDCFPAGTMILTREGYRPVEEIQVGDEVLTHLRRWRRVATTMSAIRPLVRLRGHGHPGLVVSTEHPFLARGRGQVWNNEIRRYDRVLSPPAWTKAEDLGPGQYWASPVAFPADAPPAVPSVGGRTWAISPELLWLAGRYVADGWTRLTDERAELVLTCGRHKIEALREKLAVWPRTGPRAGSDELAWHERETGTAHQFSTNSRGLVIWLREHFGHGAAEKRLPGWALGMDVGLRQALLEGYLAGDGWRGSSGERPIVEATTVSKSLAFGLKALAGSLGKTACIYERTRNNATIQGREVTVRPAWGIRWREHAAADHRQTVVEDGLEWAPVRERTDLDEEAEVFNLSVEEDESYVAEGIVVHNCTHFSVAKGGKPRKQGIRSLAWAVVRWARETRPTVICLENVAEFQGWGPLDDDGKPIKARMGETFRRWKRQLEALGYVVDHRVLDASLYGAPTRRRRLFLVARCDGQPIRWPGSTHGPGLLPVRTAAECIDWSLPCPSIFERPRPLAEKTLWRIAQGIRRFVLESANPFIVTKNRSGLVAPNLVKVNHGKREARGEQIDLPLSTVTATQRGHARVAAYLTKFQQNSVGQVPGEPLDTVMAGAQRFGVVAPTLIQTSYGERPGQRPRYLDLHQPLGTVVAQGQKHALVAAYLAKHYGDPNRKGGGGVVVGDRVERPIGTITGRDHHSLTAITLEEAAGLEREFWEQDLADAPPPRARVAEVRAFLTAYYGEDGTSGQSLMEPLRTITAKHRLGLVTVEGTEYQIADIGMRMLEPGELLRAQFGRFAEIYDLAAATTKAAKVRLIGNSVPPEVAEAVVAANLPSGWRAAA